MSCWCFCRRNHWGTSGITSTWAGQTMGYPTTPVVFSGSWKKSTARKVPFRTLDLLSFTAGTKRLETVCCVAVKKLQERFSLFLPCGHWGALPQTAKMLVKKRYNYKILIIVTSCCDITIILYFTLSKSMKCVHCLKLQCRHRQDRHHHCHWHPYRCHQPPRWDART